MVIEAEYFQIIQCIKKEFDIFEDYFKNRLKTEIPEKFKEILEFYFSKKGKRIRPALIFLLLNALGHEVCEKHYLLAFANEMIHNATLLHDDIIDNAQFRHSLPSINALYDNKLAVLAGDYLLSLALGALSEIGDSKVIKIHTTSISRLISGEIGQYFEKGEKVTIEHYLQKSRNKPAELFRAGLLSAVEISQNPANCGEIEAFSLNFGTAFQIFNDLAGIAEDIANGVSTAPVIYYSQITKVPPDIKSLQNSTAIDQTKALISEYLRRAIENIAFIEDNQYKKAIVDLCKIINQC